MSRSTRALAAMGTTAIVSAGVVGVIAPAVAHATTVSPICDAFQADPTTGAPGASLATDQQLPPLNIPAIGSGKTSVNVGETFTSTTPASPIPLPDTVSVEVGGNPTTVTLVELKNIVMTFGIAGAASVGKPTLSGGTVIGAKATSTNTSLTLTLPGSKAGSALPAGADFFPGNATFSTPAVSLSIKAPAKAGSITTTLKTMNMLALIALGPAMIPVVLQCHSGAVVGSISVQVPGAPGAIDDSVSTPMNTPITIPVLANDKPNADGAKPDPSTLEITSPPKHGTAAVTGSDIKYTPNNGFVGADSFMYQVCVFVPNPTTTTTSTTTTTFTDDAATSSAVKAAAVTPPAGTTAKCDPATVTVTVTAAAPVQTQGTVAPAAELPRTGSSSAPLAIFGFGLIGFGFVIVRAARRRVQA